MQNFNTIPTQSVVKTAQFIHADGTPDTGFSAPITWTSDQPTLATLSDGGIGAPPNQIHVTPTLPAAQNGGVVTITGKFVNENGVTINQPFTVTIVANPNPATGLLLA